MYQTEMFSNVSFAVGHTLEDGRQERTACNATFTVTNARDNVSVDCHLI